MNKSLERARARLLAVMQKRARWVLPMIRRWRPPHDPQRAVLPLRLGIDYTSVGRKTFLVTGSPPDVDEDNPQGAPVELHGIERDG